MTISFKGVSYKYMTVDVTNLCKSICDAAESYYEANRDKFHLKFIIIPPKELCDPPRINDKTMESDPIVDIINEKLKNSEKNIRLGGSVLQLLQDASDTGMIARNMVHESETSRSISFTVIPEVVPEVVPEEVSYFFDRLFPEKKYKKKIDQIINAFMASETKMGLNNMLMKIMPGEDVKEVLKRLKPFIEDWPGR